MTTKIPVELSSTPGIVDSSNATAITIDSSENVMVGATSYNNDNAGIGLGSSGFFYSTRSGSLVASFNRLSSDGTVVDFRNDSTVVGGIGVASSDLTFETNSTERIRITSSGNVGIGTTSPTANLHVSGSSAQKIDITDTSGASTRISTANSNSFVGSTTNHPLLFITNDTERMRIDSSGNFFHGGTTTFTTGVVHLRSRTISSDSFGEVVSNGEHCPHGTYRVYDTTNNATRFVVTYQGTVFATQTTISSLSDGRLKENVRELDKGLNDILKLKPIRFDWKAEEGSGKKNVSGFIAQECEEAGFEEFVDTYKFKNEMQDAKSFGYSGLIPALVKAIQEQQAIIEDLQTQINEVKNGN